MSIIKDTFFGGAEKDAAKAQQKSLERGQEILQENLQQARGEAIPLFNNAQQNLLGGFQGALDVLGRSLPAQTRAFQQGNLAAQQNILAGMPQMQNAILGGPVDYSAFQPTTINPGNLSFFQQQLPQQQTINEILNQQQAEPTTPNYGFSGPFGNRFDFSNTLGGLSSHMPGAPWQRLK